MSAQPELERLIGNVPRETRERFEIYLTLLRKWQGAINLVGPDTLDDAFNRHILDSLQLVNLLHDKDRVLFDLGSGAGFPGLVLAIVDPALEVHLVESDARKCAFLKTVSRETGIRPAIHNVRIEDLAAEGSAPVPDVLTARALAPLPQLLGYMWPWARQNPDVRILALKGERAEEELSAAGGEFDFDVTITPSLTDGRACILEIAGLVRYCE